MKKRGTIKATTAQNKKAGRKASTAETLTGTKRQLPLDFSSHAVRPHSKKASQENPTSAHNQIDVQRHQIIHSNSSSSASSAFLTSTFLSEPPVIRVNLTASKPCDRLVGYGSGPNYVFETETLTGVSNTLLEETNDLSSPEDDENDSGAVVLRAIASKASHPNNEQDCEDTETPSILDQTDTMVDDLLQTKSESQDEDRNLDTLLSPPFRWKTVYVAAFELALDTVLPEEAFLFTDEEHTIIETYRALPDDPKHLFVRLFLRKQEFWQRQDKLEGRYREIEHLKSAVQQLVVTGLVMDKSAIQDPEDALAMLTMDELKLLARRIGIMEKMSGKQRRAMISTILEHFRQQAFISKRLLLAPGGTVNGDGAGRKTGLATHAFSGDAAKRNNALIDKIIDISGPCIKIYPSVMTVFERLHLVFYRAREFTEKPALLEAILAKIGQRTFPSYEITRTNTVFRNREELLKYEAAIKLHFDLSRLIESAMGPGRESVVYVRSDESNEASGLNSPQPRKVVKPIRKPTNGINVNSIDGEPVSRGKDTERERRRLEVIGIYEKVIQEAEGIRGAWSEYVATETEISKKSSNYYLLRFSPGYVYTQILRLELRAFAFLKRFEEESILLHELLDQHVYCLGQRGGWYERLALIKSNYAFQKRLGKKEAHQICMMALRDKHVHAVDATLIQGRLIRLESELKIPFRDRHDFSYLTLRKAQTRILTGERLNTPGTAAPGYASSHSYSYIPSSTGEGLSGSRIIAQQRPLWRNIDGSDCSVEELALSYYKTLGYMGYHSENNILSTLFGLLFWDILFSPQPGVFETSYQTEPLDLRTDAFFMQRQEMIMERLENIAKSKIIEEQRVNLDQNRQGQRGGQGGEEDEPLLNRQQRPKSIHKDTLERGVNNEISFHDTIKQEFSGQDAGHPCTVQQQQTENGREEVLAKKRKECFYLNLMQTHDDLYREKNVYCVGVNWVFTKTELLEIAECIGGTALSEICKVMAQEYSKRCSGMPDLCCWDYKRKLVKFVEVKGPGDRLSSKQRIWIDLLTSLGIDTELCIIQVAKDEDAFQEEREALN